jgi:glycerophosphoryl diester phosphodiesterase
MIPPIPKLPLLIGYQGASGYAPENTLDSIDAAIEMGLKWITLDIQITQDHVPILLKDGQLDRTSNGHGSISNIKFKDLEDLEVGSHFSETFAGTPISPLEEAIDVILEHDLGVILSLDAAPKFEKIIAEGVLDCLTRIYDEFDKIMIASSHFVTLETIKDMSDEGASPPMIYKINRESPENWLEIVEYLGIQILWIDEDLAQEHIQPLMQTGKKIIFGAVTDPIAARSLQGIGITSFISASPDDLDPYLLKVH